MNSPITITESAKTRIFQLLEKRGKPSVGIRVGLKTAGCSGLSYTVEYADEISKYDEVIPLDDGSENAESGGGRKLLIDPKASMFLFGTEMDYVVEKMKSGFTFTNPNEKGRCGCGKSFHV
jgi:iron-sulfur cluster assembly protein